MKKVFAIVLVLLLLSGCSGNGALPENSIGVSNTESSSTTNETTDNAVDNVEGKPQYDDNMAIYIGRDRNDVDDDGNTIYQYNVKGELLNSVNKLAYIGVNSKYNLFPVLDPSSGKIGFVDQEGVFVIEPNYDDATVFAPCGLATVKIEGEDHRDYCGVIDITGKEVVPCFYPYISSYFPSGYAVYSQEITTEDGGSYTKYGIIDKTGKIIVKANYYLISYVYDGYFVSDRYIYDFSEKVLAETYAFSRGDGSGEADFQYYMPTSEALYRLTIRDKTIRGKGNLIMTEYFDGSVFRLVETDYELSSKRVATTESGIGYGIIVGEKTVIPFQYDQIHRIGSYFVCTKYNSVTKQQMFDIYDINYNKTAENLNYYIADPWHFRQCLPDGFFYVYNYAGLEETICGVIDATGSVIIEPVFSEGITYCTYENVANYPLSGKDIAGFGCTDPA